MSPPTKERLIGGWQLLSYISYVPSDPSANISPLGSSATGCIFYHPDGYMSAHLQDPTVPKFPSEDPWSVQNEKFARDEPDGHHVIGPEMPYIGYAGNFDVGTRIVEGKETEVVNHHVFNASFPNWVGGLQERTVNWEAGENGKEILVLGNEGLGNIRIGKDGKGRFVRVKWTRMAQRQ